MDFTRTYDTSEVAELCHVTRRTVYNWIKSGLLKGEKVGPHRWIVRGAYLKAFLEHGTFPRKPAAPQPVVSTPAPSSALSPPAPSAPSLMQSRPAAAVQKKKNTRR